MPALLLNLTPAHLSSLCLLAPTGKDQRGEDPRQHRAIRAPVPVLRVPDRLRPAVRLDPGAPWAPNLRGEQPRGAGRQRHHHQLHQGALHGRRDRLAGGPEQHDAQHHRWVSGASSGWVNAQEWAA